MTSEVLKEAVKTAVTNYLRQLDGVSVRDLYKVILSTVEGPMLEVLMKHVKHNQSKAAELLGLSRGTTRKKLKEHDLLD